MLKYRGSQLARAGFIGVVVLLLVVAVGLQPERITAWARSMNYQAIFADAAGLAAGNAVTRSGIKVGEVDAISLEKGKALVTFSVAAQFPLGSQTTAHIRTGTLLGERVLTVQSSGSVRMRRGDVIPLTRTSSPYSLTDAVGDLTQNTAATNTDTLNQSLQTLASTLDQIAPQLGPTFDGFARLSESINARDENLDDLLKSAAGVTDVLAQRSDLINTMLLNANDLIGVLNDRREVIVALLAGTANLAQQIKGLVNDNRAKLAPTLDKLNAVAEMLEKNRDNISKALPGLAKYQLTQGEAVSGGFHYDAFVANLLPSQMLQPFLDYAFGFRRGVDAGQPPDNAGPRAELPLPYNGIPGGSR
ncbi:MCE family protein [Mycobacterium sp. DL440]|uniref:MCE family protein n=1 Tax=Mycobacterium sp. DL440 TaxID=2675523 RepID=UPI0014205889|nr:MCE family protein [Mycobacterium sp. DL440]